VKAPTREELLAQQRVALRDAQAYAQLRVALGQMHDAAVMRGAKIEAEQYRHQIHSAVDSYLDATARFTELARALFITP